MRGGSGSRRNAGVIAAELEATQATPPERPSRAHSPILVRARQADDTGDIRAEPPLNRAATEREEESLPSVLPASQIFFRDMSLTYVLQSTPPKPSSDAHNPSLEGEAKKIVDSRKPKLFTPADMQAHFRKVGVPFDGNSFSTTQEECLVSFANGILDGTGFTAPALYSLSVDGSLVANGVNPFQGAAQESANIMPTVNLRPTANNLSVQRGPTQEPFTRFALKPTDRLSALSKLSIQQQNLVGMRRHSEHLPEEVYCELHANGVEGYKRILSGESTLSEAALIHAATRATAQTCLFDIISTYLQLCQNGGPTWIKTSLESDFKTCFSGYDDDQSIPTALSIVFGSHYRLSADVGARAWDALLAGFGKTVGSANLDHLALMYTAKFSYGQQSLFSFLNVVKELTDKAAHNVKAPPGTQTLPNAVKPQHPATSEACGIQVFVSAVSQMASFFTPHEKRELHILVDLHSKDRFANWGDLCIYVERLQSEGFFPGADIAVANKPASAPVSYGALERQPLDRTSPQTLEQYVQSVDRVKDYFIANDKRLFYRSFEQLKTVPNCPTTTYRVLLDNSKAERKPFNTKELWDAVKTAMPLTSFELRQDVFNVIGACVSGTPKYIALIHNAVARNSTGQTSKPEDSSRNGGGSKKSSAKSAEDTAKERDAALRELKIVQEKLHAHEAAARAQSSKEQRQEGFKKKDSQAGKGGKGKGKGKEQRKSSYLSSSAEEDDATSTGVYQSSGPSGSFYAGGGRMNGSYGMGPFPGPPQPMGSFPGPSPMGSFLGPSPMGPFPGHPPTPYAMYTTPFVQPPPVPIIYPAEQIRQMQPQQQQLSLQQQMMLQRQMPSSPNLLAITATPHNASGDSEGGHFAQSGAPSGAF